MTDAELAALIKDMEEPGRALTWKGVQSLLATARERSAEAARLRADRDALLKAAKDAVETYEAGGMPGGPIMHLKDAVEQAEKG